MKHLNTFEIFLNENANKKITVSLAYSAVKSFKKDLDGNKIPYTVVRPTVFELEDTPKARTAIQMAKERFGMQSVLVKESSNEVIFSVDDDKLDQMLNARFSRQLDYKDDKGDSLYVLPKREFDQFIDLADSSGFDVDYGNSEDSVVYVQESTVNEGEQIKKGDFVRYKKDEEFTGGKVLNISSGKAEISNWDGSTIELPVADLEYIESWNR